MSQNTIQTAYLHTGEKTLAPAIGRRLRNWIESFTQYSFPLQTPSIFRKWAGISIVSAVMERKIWAKTKGSTLYPNLYVILVAPPGVGKSNILSNAETLLRQVPEVFVAPSSLTTAALIDTVALAKQQLAVPNLNGAALEYNSLFVIASELGVFLPAYEPSFMNSLTKLYDGEYYEERRRTGKVNHLVIERPLLSILGGTTPGYLGSFLPDGAWDQGFTARTIFVFSNEQQEKPIWSNGEDTIQTAQLANDLVADLGSMAKAYGETRWTQDCMDAVNGWNSLRRISAPDHVKLEHYNTRRLAHLLKLCMIAALARGNSLEVTLDDFSTARRWLLEVEQDMTEIFNALGKTIEANVIMEALGFLKKLYERDNHRPVSEHLLYTFLRDKIPAHSISKVIEIMERSQGIRRVYESGLTRIIPL